VLDSRDLDEALVVCERDVVANLFVAARLMAAGVPGNDGGELWGYYAGGELSSLCWSGANMVPVEADDAAIDAFAARARRVGRQCSSIVGPSSSVIPLWERLQDSWGPPREVRGDQPLMSTSRPPLIEPDSRVRRSRPDELGMVVPACIDMFTEEVGYSPVVADGGALYHAQVTSLVVAGRSFIRVDEDADPPEIVFKAELGSVTPWAVQVQGVWVAPRFRGMGLSGPAMAAVVQLTRERVAPVVSLYVNAFNRRAIRTYQRVGFTTVGSFATVLF
jgi:predicted GNAT family acetyltransferase